MVYAVRRTIKMVYEGIINPLDLETIFIGYVAGSVEIFVVLLLIFLAIISAKWKIPTPIFLIFAAVLTLVLAGINTTWLIITGILVAIALVITLAKQFGSS